MDTFILKQDRFAIQDSSGTLSFRIDLNCKVISDDTHEVVLTPDVFVYSTDSTLEADISSGGSIDGSFLRVGTISDLGNLPINREAALSSNKTEYRSRVLQLSMPDLETAVNSIPVIVDRVSSLVSAYIEYQTNFYSRLPVEYRLPTATDSSVVNRYVNAYSNAVSARASATSEQESLQVEFQAFQVKNEILTSYRDELDSYESVLEDAKSSVASLSATSETLTGDLLAAKLKVDNSLALLQAIKQNRGAQLTASKAQEDFSSSKLKDKQNEVERLEATEADTLADLATFCPQIDPSSVS